MIRLNIVSIKYITDTFFLYAYIRQLMLRPSILSITLHILILITISLGFNNTCWQ